MQVRDADTLFSILQPRDRFVFGIGYLYQHVRSIITGKDTATPFLQAECLKQSDKLRLLEVGDYQP